MVKKRNAGLLLVGIAIAIIIIFVLPKLQNKTTNSIVYSVAGVGWACDANARSVPGTIFSTGYFSFGDKGQYNTIKSYSLTTADNPCSGGSPLYDTFIDYKDGKGWIPKTEYKSSLPTFSCPTGAECIVELYCCPKFDCTSDSDCNTRFGGSGYTCVNGIPDPYISLSWGTSYKYCVKAADPAHRCWRLLSNTCEEHSPAYTQSYLDTNYGGSCPQTWPYESLASCQAAIIPTKTCYQKTSSGCVTQTLQTTSACSALGYYDTYDQCVAAAQSCYTKSSLDPNKCTVYINWGGGLCTAPNFPTEASCLCYISDGNVGGTSCAGIPCKTAGTTRCSDGICRSNCAVTPPNETCPMGTTKCTDGVCRTSCGSKVIGASCDSDTECSSLHCDKSHWYSLSSTCQSIPLSEIKKLALTKEVMKTATDTMLVSSACLTPSECTPTQEGVKVSCPSIASLRADGTLTSAQSSSIFTKANSIMTGTAAGAAIGGTLGVVACGASIAASIGLILIPGVDAISAGTAITICGLAAGTTTTGAIVGGAIGYVTAGSEKDPLVQKLKASDANGVGICLQESSGGGLCISAINDFMSPITKQDCQTNTIIFFAVIALLLILIIK